MIKSTSLRLCACLLLPATAITVAVQDHAYALVFKPGPEDDVEDDIEDDIDDKVEDKVEDDIEDDIEDKVEGDIEDKVEDEIEDDIEDRSSGKVEDRIDDRISDRISNSGKGSRSRDSREAEDRAAKRAEDQISNSGSGNRVRDRSDKKAEDRIDDDERLVRVPGLAQPVNETFFDDAERSLKDERQAARQSANLERKAARDLARAERDAALAAGLKDEAIIEAEYRTAVEAADLAREEAKEQADETFEIAREELREQEDQYEELAEGASSSGRLPSNFDPDIGASEELTGIDKDSDGFDIAAGEWLVLSSGSELDAIERTGFLVRAREELAMLGQVMARVAPPSGWSFAQGDAALRRLAPTAEVDFNHLYAPQLIRGKGPRGVKPLAAMPLSKAQRRTAKKIGLIDTSLAMQATGLHGRNIIGRDFVRSGNRRPVGHGTAVASILAGQRRDYAGLIPNSRLYAASAFEILPKRGQTATTASLVRALNWMAANDVGIVNMSLTGPHNNILQRAIRNLRQRDVVIVAAVGNGGPSAKPLYPAGYSDVVSVTAVDTNRRIFRLANRGRYLDFAAPGVNISHISENGQLDSASGTSIAAPFAATALLLSSDKTGHIDGSVIEKLRLRAFDLGARGHDPIYGYGMIRPLP